MKIRASSGQDKERLFLLHRSAFAKEEAGDVAQLVLELLEDKTALPLLSLLAEQDGDIIGHILFSSVSVKGADAGPGYILAPLAVLDAYQGQGVGTALISRGLALLKSRGADFVLVLGDPGYYSRFGFNTDHSIRAPYALAYPQAWMALALKKAALNKIKGELQCAVSLCTAKYW